LATTIKDVAKHAGVGIGTVSRVINNEKAVGDRTRKKVLESMRVLNYSPNNMASQLRKNKTSIIALLVPVVNHPFFAKLAYYVEDEADRFGYSVILVSSQQRVEKEKKISWLEITNGVRTNYSSPASKRVQAFMKTAEKFGQGDNLGLKWAKKISEMFASIVVSGHSEEGVRFIPGLFSWSQTIKFGQAVGATPDGRKAGEAINHGANPMPGAVKSGEMTTMSESIAAIQCRKGNTAPFQMELDPCISESEGGIEKVMALLRTHLEHGGTLINVNILDAQKILEAHADPSLYPDLVVRVTGFTAYFASLSPEFRQLVVDRIMAAN